MIIKSFKTLTQHEYVTLFQNANQIGIYEFLRTKAKICLSRVICNIYNYFEGLCTLTRCSSGAIWFVRLFISMEVNASVHTDEVPAVAKYPNNIKPKLVCSEYDKNCKIIHLSLGSFMYNIRKNKTYVIVLLKFIII